MSLVVYLSVILSAFYELTVKIEQIFENLLKPVEKSAKMLIEVKPQLQRIKPRINFRNAGKDEEYGLYKMVAGICK